MLYETVNPFTMREPAGTIGVADARYTAIDDRIVRVEGSRFEPVAQHTIKLEGAAVAGYETVSFTGIRDPRILASLDEWAQVLHKTPTERVAHVLDLATDSWSADPRLYGYNAIPGDLVPTPVPPKEVGVMLAVSARDHQTATGISKIANPLLLHLPLPSMTYLPSFAFATSPAHIDRGAAYEFVLNHVVDVDRANCSAQNSRSLPMPDPTHTPQTLGDQALEVRSKNAGPLWMTLEAFMPDDEALPRRRIWVDKVSGKLARRPEWDKRFEHLRRRDELVITRLSRPFRSVRHMTELAAQLAERGIDLIVLKQGTPPRPGGSCSTSSPQWTR